jgi:hypothetical protein
MNKWYLYQYIYISTSIELIIFIMVMCIYFGPAIDVCRRPIISKPWPYNLYICQTRQSIKAWCLLLLRSRMSQHRYDAKDPKYRILYNHFNQPGHDRCLTMKVRIIEKIYHHTNSPILSIRGKSKHYYSLDNTILQQVPSNVYLGNTIAEDLKWNSHINNITKKANTHRSYASWFSWAIIAGDKSSGSVLYSLNGVYIGSLVRVPHNCTVLQGWSD